MNELCDYFGIPEGLEIPTITIKQMILNLHEVCND